MCQDTGPILRASTLSLLLATGISIPAHCAQAAVNVPTVKKVQRDHKRERSRTTERLNCLILEMKEPAGNGRASHAELESQPREKGDGLSRTRAEGL